MIFVVIGVILMLADMVYGFHIVFRRLDVIQNSIDLLLIKRRYEASR